MESRLSLLRMHWDHEPTPNPSQEGNFRAADECLLPSWEGSGVGRFMESLLGLMIMHWDHEPGRAQRRAGVPPAQRARQRERFRAVGVADGCRRDACPTFRFMERENRMQSNAGDQRGW